MFAPHIKQAISEAVQDVLKRIEDPELPKGEIQFILHVDGDNFCSWANIKNNNAIDTVIPVELVGNLTSNKGR